jgi:hypothetical protein
LTNASILYGLKMRISIPRLIPGLLAAMAMAGLTACSNENNASSTSEGQPATQTESVNAASSTPAQASEREPVNLMHVHGLAYSPEGKYLYIPSHLGLAVYDHESWSKAPGYMHDYMGFVGTKDAFYTSGHPAMGSGFVNPFGLMKSVNGGQTWEKLGMEGETDFHNVAASYNTNAIYVFNPAPNSKMKSAGLYSTTDDGKTWRKAAAKGLNSEPFTVAVHPDEPNKVAIAATDGLYVSEDGGDTFRRVVPGNPVTAVHYDLDGKRIWFATNNGGSQLHVYDLVTGKDVTVGLPAGESDPIGYIAQNPANTDEYAMATFARDVYLSQDSGKTWKAIAREGETISK